MSLFKRVLILMFLLLSVSFIIMTYVQNISIIYQHTIYNPSEIEKDLTKVREYIKYDYKEHQKYNRPVDNTTEISSILDKRLLMLEEFDILKKDLKFNIIISSLITPLVSLIFMGLFVFILLRYLFNPVESLTDSMKKYSQGDDTAFPIRVTGVPEARLLLSTTNSMMDTIKVQKETISVQSRFIGWKNSAREIVHEIKNILTPVRLSAESSMEIALDAGNSVIKSDMNKILASLRSLERMAESLKELAGMREPNPVRFDLYEMAEEAVTFYQKVFPSIKITGEHSRIVSDRDLLRSALDNLIVNSIESLEGRDDGEIVVHIGSGEKVFAECSDNGPGIADDIRDKIFRLNFTTKEKGSGFGLYFVKKIMDDHGFRIEVDTGLNEKGVSMRMVF